MVIQIPHDDIRTKEGADMRTFPGHAAMPFMVRTAKKKRFGGIEFPFGPFLTITTWVYQLGGLAAYAFADKPELIGKLCAGKPPYGSLANDLMANMKDSNADRLNRTNSTNPTFFDLFLFQELEREGIKIGSAQGERKMNQGIKDPEVSTMVIMTFIEGASLGWNFPERFKQVYEATYDSDEMIANYREMASQGLTVGQPQRIPIVEAIAELRSSVLDWAGGDPSAELSAEETAFLRTT
jgi:hypothetical protein